MKQLNTLVIIKNIRVIVVLSDFPVINKLVIKNNAEDFTIVKPKGDKLFKVSTSGSTGTPFSIYQTKRKKNKK